MTTPGSSRRWTAAGIIGAAVAALCCFTPVLAVLLAAVGLSAWLGYADYVAMPALVLFLAFAGWGFYRQASLRDRREEPDAAGARRRPAPE